MKKIEPLRPQDLNCNIFSVYDYDDMSMQELLCEFFTKINECIEVSQQALTFTEWLVNVGLSQKVVEILNQWKNDGTLANIIGRDVFAEINNKIDTLDRNINNKVDGIKTNLEEKIYKKDKVNIRNFNGYNNDNDAWNYEMDAIKLDAHTFAYYDKQKDPELLNYPSVGMNKDGVLVFNGVFKIEGGKNEIDPGLNMMKMGEILENHIPHFQRLTGVPLSGFATGSPDSDGNQRTTLPFVVKPDGTIWIKNLDQHAAEYQRIELNGVQLKLPLAGRDYVNKYIKKKVINTIMPRRSGAKSQFIFFTDLHHSIFADNRYDTLKAIKQVSSYISPDFILNGGDNINEPFNHVKNANVHNVLMTHKQVFDSFNFNQLVYCNGNHDSNYLQPPQGQNIVKPSQVKPFIQDDKTVWAGTDKWYGYRDIEECKIRVVILDTHESTHDLQANIFTKEQLKWIAGNALNIKDKGEDWGTIFIGHTAPLDDDIHVEGLLPYRSDIRRMIESFNNSKDFEFDGEIYRYSEHCCKGVVYAYLYGHTHVDYNIMINGINYINTGNAWEQDYGKYSNRVNGTETEYLFDVVTVVPGERKLYFDRIGVGEDRVFNY